MQKLELLNADGFLYNTSNEERIITEKTTTTTTKNSNKTPQREEAGKS